MSAHDIAGVSLPPGRIPLVTVVIPAYNAELFIAEAVDSVLAQTYRQFECVVVDDGSLDATPDVLARYGDQIKVLRQVNRGVAAARNAGIRHGLGDLIAILDADDVWIPSKLAEQVAMFQADATLALVYGAVQVVDEQLRPLRLLAAPQPGVALRNTLLMEQPVMSIPSVGMFRRSTFEAVGGFDESMSTSADTDFACRVAARFPIGSVQRPLALYRQHGAQMHRSIRPFQHDMTLLYRKMFDEVNAPPEVANLRRRAHANLYASVAGWHFERRHRLQVAGYTLRACCFDARRVVELLGRRRNAGSSKGRVVLFAPGLSEAGGVARRAGLLATGLAARGWDVRAITRSGTATSFSRNREGSLDVVEVPGFDHARLGAVLYFLVALPLGLLWTSRARAVLCVQLLSPSTVGLLCGRLLGRPVALLSTTMGPTGELAYLRSRRYAKFRMGLLRKASTIVTQTPEAAAEVDAHVGIGRTRVVGNPVVLVEAPVLTGKPTVAFLGRFSEDKDLLLLLSAWREVLRAHPSATLTLAGAGGKYKSVETQLRGVLEKDSDIRGSVSLPGWVRAETVLGEHDLFVLPSRTEGMSNALLEACAWGRAVVASDIPGNRAVLGDDYPLLFEVGNRDGLADTLIRALSDRESRAEASRRVLERVQRFSVETFLNDVEEVLAHATDRTRHQHP